MRTRWRWVMPALVVLSAALAWVAPANAAWTLEKILWRHRGAGALGFSQPASGFSDTLYVSGAPARADTTTEWNMLDCDNFTGGAYGTGAAVEDSLASAFLVIQADSSVASTVDYKNSTISFQVNYGSSDVGWVSTTTTAYAHNFTAGAKIVHQPIFNHIATFDKDATAEIGGVVSSGTAGVFAPRMRAIVTWGTAAAVPQARLFVKKWVTSTILTRQAKDY